MIAQNAHYLHCNLKKVLYREVCTARTTVVEEPLLKKYNLEVTILISAIKFPFAVITGDLFEKLHALVDVLRGRK